MSELIFESCESVESTVRHVPFVFYIFGYMWMQLSKTLLAAERVLLTLRFLSRFPRDARASSIVRTSCYAALNRRRQRLIKWFLLLTHVCRFSSDKFIQTSCSRLGFSIMASTLYTHSGLTLTRSFNMIFCSEGDKQIPLLSSLLVAEVITFTVCSRFGLVETAHVFSTHRSSMPAKL